jgi:CsoR family transcriptional regulator, copper-sensing transcriptional repressor
MSNGGAHDGRPSRRWLLRAGLAAAAVAGTGGWRAAPAGPTRRTGLRQPGSLPYPQLPAGTDTIPQIGDHLEGLLHRPGHARAVPPLYFKNLGTKIVPIADFFTDAATGTLPGYCIAEPDYSVQSEENPQNIAVGEAFATHHPAAGVGHPPRGRPPPRTYEAAGPASTYCHSMRGYTQDKDAYLKRLRRIEGQVRGLQRMVEEDVYCIDVLTQVSAVTRALQAVALGLLEDHLGACVSDAVRAGGDEGRASVHEAAEAISRLVKS